VSNRKKNSKSNEPASAWAELLGYLEPGETVEALVFGAWGWGSEPEPGCEWEPYDTEPSPPPVPFNKRGVPLSLVEAGPMMLAWKFRGGYGSPTCYATWIWTDRRVIWVTQYDGSTRLSSMPRHPCNSMPYMPGG